jgi:hypothetical protein
MIKNVASFDPPNQVDARYVIELNAIIYPTAGDRTVHDLGLAGCHCAFATLETQHFGYQGTDTVHFPRLACAKHPSQ